MNFPGKWDGVVAQRTVQIDSKYADNEIQLIGSPVNARDNAMVAGVKLDINNPGTYP